MHDIPLNDTQRIFAEKNHNLVYKFLHEKNLPASEYYDIVIFGYLRAVQRYLTDPNLAGYSFATVAWRAMEGEVVNTYRTDKRRFRVIRFVRPRQSYTGHLTRRSTPTVTDEEALRESEVALLLHALAKRVTPQQMEIIRLRTKGYQTNEIAQIFVLLSTGFTSTPKGICTKTKRAASANTQDQPSYFYLSEQHRQIIRPAVQYAKNLYRTVFLVHTVENQLL